MLGCTVHASAPPALGVGPTERASRHWQPVRAMVSGGARPARCQGPQCERECFQCGSAVPRLLCPPAHAHRTCPHPLPLLPSPQVRTILSKEGVRRGLYAGYGALMLRDLPFDAIEFVSYEQVQAGFGQKYTNRCR